ncbi:MAG: fibronectin type III domain-containing protein [Limisphaerales bacterium]
MENRLKRTVNELMVSAMDAANGAFKHGGAIGLMQNTGIKIQDDLSAVHESARDYALAREAEAKQRRVVNRLVNDCRQLLTLSRDNFKPLLGSSHNPAWVVTGLTGSLVIPRRTEEVQELMLSFKEYLGSHSTQEVTSKKITATEFEERLGELKEARGLLHQRAAQANDAKATRDKSVKQLCKRLRDLIKELKMLLGPLDPRWIGFGLNMPGAKLRPQPPAEVTARVLDDQAALVQWKAAPKAEYYRVWLREEGSPEAEFKPVGSPGDLDFLIEALPAGKAFTIAVSAVNSGGESSLSESLSLQFSKETHGELLILRT